MKFQINNSYRPVVTHISSILMENSIFYWYKINYNIYLHGLSFIIKLQLQTATAMNLYFSCFTVSSISYLFTFFLTGALLYCVYDDTVSVTISWIEHNLHTCLLISKRVHYLLSPSNSFPSKSALPDNRAVPLLDYKNDQSKVGSSAIELFIILMQSVAVDYYLLFDLLNIDFIVLISEFQ